MKNSKVFKYCYRCQSLVNLCYTCMCQRNYCLECYHTESKVAHHSHSMSDTQYNLFCCDKCHPKTYNHHNTNADPNYYKSSLKPVESIFYTYGRKFLKLLNLI